MSESTEAAPTSMQFAALEETEPWAIEAIRRDERRHLSALLDKSADTIGAFATDGPAAVRLVAYMLTLKD